MRKFWDNSGDGETGVSPVGSAAAARAWTPVPSSLSIGGVKIAPATVLAPMAGVTDTVFRRFIRNLGGCGLIMTEFTSADGVLRKKDQKAKRYLHFYEDEHPISAQLFGSDPYVMAEAARMVEDLGFDLIDLNLGCPAKKVVKCNGGSGLLRDLPRIEEIFKAVRAAVTIPFTVKFRIGWSDSEVVCVDLAKMAEASGLCAVALHARTREQGYSGQARWEWIAAVKDAVKIPVIGNGDIRTPEDACAMVAQTGCDAVMIGRMAPSNPWIFRQIEQYCKGMEQTSERQSLPQQFPSGREGRFQGQFPEGRFPRGQFRGEVPDGQFPEGQFPEGQFPERQFLGGQFPGGHIREGHDFSRAENAEAYAALAAEGNARTSGAKAPDFNGSLVGTAEAVPFPNALGDSSRRRYDQPTEADRYQMIRTYFQMLIEEELPDAEGKMKQFASWFTHGVPGGAALRKGIYDSKSAPEILSRVEEFFEKLLATSDSQTELIADQVSTVF